jgi:hypothetical protein
MLRSVAASCARQLALGGAAGLFFGGGCLKSLDEAKIRDQPVRDGSSGTASTDGSAARGGSDGSGGTGGSLGSGGTTGSGGGGSGGQPAVFIPYDAARYPVTNLQGNIPAPVIIAADTARVFRSTKNSEPGSLVAQDIAGGPGASIYQGLSRPQRLSTNGSSEYTYVAAGRSGDATSGSIWRISKSAGDAGTMGEEVTTPAPIELAVGIFAAPDGFAYVSAKSATANNPGLLRFALGAGQNAEVLYRSDTGNETGGDVTESGGCVYWISNGNLWVIPTAGGTTRSNALSAPITDAVGLASDGQRFYYTRSNGEVWQRQRSTAACDGPADPEQRIAEGFISIGDVIVWDTTVAWTAKNFSASGANGGGVFTTPVGGGAITQIAPKEGDPEEIEQGATAVVFSTATGRIAAVPKTPR